MIDEFLKQLRWHHGLIGKALEAAPDEALEWSTETARNSMCVLATHIAGSERYWMESAIGGAPSTRDRDAEFRAKGVPRPGLLQELDAALAAAERVASPLTAADLAQTRTLSRHTGDHTYSVAWILLHVLEHTAYHGGQLNVMGKLWRSR